MIGEEIKNILEKQLTENRVNYLRDINKIKDHDALYNLRTITMIDLVYNNNDGDLLNNELYFSFNKDLKIFDIDENLLNLFKRTKNSIYKRKLPFDSFFLNVNLKIEDCMIFGIGISEGFADDAKKNIISFLISGMDLKSKKTINIAGALYNEDMLSEKYPDKRMKRIKEDCRLIVCNFLDFINHTDVDIKKIEGFNNNERRIKKGKFPVPDRTKIQVKGKLKRYIYETMPNMIKNSPGISFWVRGHYIHFWNKKRYNGLYGYEENILQRKGYFQDKNGIICKWILPYIKGKGEIKTKEYNLKKVRVTEEVGND